MFNIVSMTLSPAIVIIYIYIYTHTHIHTYIYIYIYIYGDREREKGIATHSNILAWSIPWTEEPGRL